MSISLELVINIVVAVWFSGCILAVAAGKYKPDRFLVCLLFMYPVVTSIQSIMGHYS